MAGKYTAHHEVRQNLGCLLWITGFGGLGMVGSGVSALPTPAGWLQLMIGIDLVAVAAGIWFAKEWARWAAGIIAAFQALRTLGAVIGKIQETETALPLIGLIPLALWSLLAWYALKPSTRRRFAEAREAIARKRALVAPSTTRVR